MKKFYVAAPMFNEMEKERNLRIDKIVRKIGFNTYLPQRDGGIVDDLKKNVEESKHCDIEKKIFNLDIEKLSECDYLLFLLDGAVLDDGSCFELGYMFALGKPCFGYKTDLRNFGDGKLNLMIEKSLIKIAFNEKDLYNLITSVKENNYA